MAGLDMGGRINCRLICSKNLDRELSNQRQSVLRFGGPASSFEDVEQLPEINDGNKQAALFFCRLLQKQLHPRGGRFIL